MFKDLVHDSPDMQKYDSTFSLFDEYIAYCEQIFERRYGFMLHRRLNTSILFLSEYTEEYFVIPFLFD